MHRGLRHLFLIGFALWASPALSQAIYGTGAAGFVPQADPAAIQIDGVRGETEPWDQGLRLNLTQNWAGGWNEGVAPTPDLSATARVLYGQDSLYVFVDFEDYELFFEQGDGAEWASDNIYIGIDPIHDPAYQEEGGFEGWPGHAPDSVFAVRFWDRGLTIRGDSVLGPESDWVRHQMVIDAATAVMRVEAVFYVPGLAAGDQIGFNVGGSSAIASLSGTDNGAAYAFFSWQAGENPGGDVLNSTTTYGTLAMLPAGEPLYGTGQGGLVPGVRPGDLQIDGVRGETEPWDQGLRLNLTQNWAGGWNEGVAPTPDLSATARVLYGQDSLYVFVDFEDYELFFEQGDGAEWASDNIYIGIDPIHDPAYQEEGGFEGWPGHAPDSVFAVRFWDRGLTIRGDSVLGPESDWVRHQMVIDAATAVMRVEAVFYVPGLAAGDQIGFNVGGSSAIASLSGTDNGAAYAFFSWQAGENPGGDVLNSTTTYGTLIALDALVGTAIEEEPMHELPTGFTLDQNYPNPFNPSTNIRFGLDRPGHVRVDVYNTVGQRVATLVDAPRAAGTYRLAWDAAHLASGLYVYRLTVDGAVVAARKMLLLR